ncbi:MAG: cobalamin B12-binding domain-containing protein [Dehalococcoidia bacterium]
MRVLIAKPGLDGHDVGAKVIVRALLDAGFDVQYTGLKNSPAQIVQRARETRPDVLGLSILSGSHCSICERVAAGLRAEGLQDMLWIVGGNIPRQDEQALRRLGVSAVFSVGSSTDAVVQFIRERCHV